MTGVQTCALPIFSTVGTWGTDPTGDGSWGVDYAWSAGGTGADIATWDAELLNGAGEYEVFVWFPYIADTAATDAPYTVNHANGSTTILLDQSYHDNAQQWLSIGIYNFNDNPAEGVTISDNANSWVMADAVRFEPACVFSIEPLEIITDFLPDGNVDISYSATLQAQGGTTPNTWNIDPLQLPAGLSYNSSTGEIYGIPTTEGTSIFTVEVTDISDPQLSDTKQLSITTNSGVPVDGIVDNADIDQFRVVGTWGTAPPPPITGQWETDLRFHAGGGTGAETVTWDAELPDGPGVYDVSVWYLAAAVLASDAPFTVNHADGSTTVVVNQQINGSQWVSLGSFNFDGGVSEGVTVSDNASGWVVADAVKFEPCVIVVDGIIDNADCNFNVVGTWGTAPPPALTGIYGADLRYHAVGGTGAETATWAAELVDGPGTYEVSVWYIAAGALASDAPFTVNHVGGSTTVSVNQQVNGSQWVSLGSFDFDGSASEGVTLSDNANSWVIADAVRFVRN